MAQTLATWNGSLVLTGASGGLGRALAAECAAPGVTMLLLGRDRARLAVVAAEARDRGADVETAAIDLRDAPAMHDALLAFDRMAPVAAVIANAGQSGGAQAGDKLPEPPGTMARLAAVNLVGAANTVEPLLPSMMARDAGRIALIGSLAGVLPLAAMPAYSATKAGLAAWAMALRAALSGTGVTVTMVEPGFVTTPMSARHHGTRPMEIEAPAAARHILRAVQRGRPALRFPRWLATLASAGAALPWPLCDHAARVMHATIEPAVDS
ncbi:MAG: SDR family NAD(P)-dependent oxidoreductase [Pseudomonadota bacterium]